MKKIKFIKKKVKELPLWKLTIYTADIERRIVEKKMQGMKSDQSSLKKTRNIRAIYRKELLNKLKNWNKKKDKEIIDPINYSDLQDLNMDIDLLELKKLEEENGSKKISRH